MSAQILSAELSNLVQESKKRNPELKAAAEKSLKDLKALSITSEAQVAADLSRRPSFINPFLVACNTRNARLAAIAVVCLQRLVVSRALPKERLKEVLEAFRECSSQGSDIQLKILQALPSLSQNYHQELHGELLNDAFQICCILQSSKTAVITNTATATLQQLVVSIFDQVVVEDRTAKDSPSGGEFVTTDGPVAVRTAALDAFRVLEDLCLLIDGQRPHFLRTSSLPQNLGVELIESVLTSHADLVRSHPEQIHVLRTRLMPFLTKALAKSFDFPLTVRVLRVIDNILKCHLSILASECETLLSLMTALLDPEKAVLWKRALCMEVFRDIHGEPGLPRRLYAEYDEQDGRKPILSDHMAALARLATEKPTIIGLGKMSTTPVGSAQLKDLSSQQAAMEAGGVAGTIGAAVGVAELDIPGISVQWSSIRIPCLDQLDKSEPPSLPDSYIYSLVLTCINSFSEGLAKFILPLTTQNDSKIKRKQKPPVVQDLKRTSEIKDDGSVRSFQIQEHLVTPSSKRDQVPINPLSLTSDPRHRDIQTSAAIIETCWPAVLAITSTYLYASLDSECHHSLVRSFQKFTHVAGLLRLNTPRDAFMTTLGKAAVPAGSLTPNTASTPTTPAVEAQDAFQNARGLLSVDNLLGHATSIGTDKYPQAVESNSNSLNVRHLLCLRALLNLGIALGPILSTAWSIVLETLQQADFVITAYRNGTRLPGFSNRQKDDSQANEEAPKSLASLSGEIMAVESAASRMFESTSGFTNDGFKDFVTALCNLAESVDLEVRVYGSKATSIVQSSSRTPSQSHKRQVSGTRFPTSIGPQSEDYRFVLLRLGDIADINILRLTSYRPSENGWDIICGQLVKLLSPARSDTTVRLNAAKVLNRLILSAFGYVQSQPAGAPIDVQILGLSTLRAEIQSLYARSSEEIRPVHGVDTEIHHLALETLKSVLEQWGGVLIAGWEIVFDIISSTFHEVESVLSTVGGHNHSTTLEQRQSCSTRSPELVRSSFNSLRLICSDFLSSLSTPCILMLVDTLYRFCSQPEDFNISLTTTAIFWTVSDFIQGLSDELDLDALTETGISLPRVLETAKDKHLEVAAPALWLISQIRLIAVTRDSRLEVRNGAVHTTLRIFEAYGYKLTPSAWKLCLRTIIFKMMEANDDEYVQSESTERPGDSVNGGGWNKTAIIIVQGVGRLVATSLDKIRLEASFSTLWKDLLRHLEAYLRRRSLKLHAAVYQAIHHILSEDQDIKSIGKPSVELIWTLWMTHNPAVVPTIDGNKENNVAALTAYMESFKVLYPLIDTALTFERVERILDNLRLCAFNANLSRFSADVDTLTPLQVLVLDCLKLIRGDISGVPSILVGLLADMVSKPFKDDSHMGGAEQPSFIALSQAAMDLLDTYTARHRAHVALLASGALTQSIDALVIPINLKYQRSTEGKQGATWRKATSVATSILAQTLPVLRDSSFDEEKFQDFWKSVVRLVNGITADDRSSSSLSALTLEDEEFDISAFICLRNLITPSLGSSLVSDTVRQSYTSFIFTNSIIHNPHRQDLPRPDQGPLENLYATHMGRTFDPPPTRRSRMCYVLLDELFSLVAVYHHQSGRYDHVAERIKLAQAAAPFLILRAAVVLKAYIADQPLRGLMPQPMSQKRELIYIVRKLVELESEPRAIPDAQGVRSEHKKHLHRLFPLVTRAVGVAWRDESLLRELQRVLEVVGEGFGVG